MTRTDISVEGGKPLDPERRRELKTVQYMIRLYCRQKHHAGSICTECSELIQYVERRLRRCAHESDKPACKDCQIHCFREPYRTTIRKVMKYAGPRMLWRHPILAIRHLLQ